MPASYPSNLKSFSTKVDFDNVVFAENVNSLQEEVVAVQTVLGTSPATSSGWVGSFDSSTLSWPTVKARINNLEYGLKTVFDRVGSSVATTGTGALVFGTSPTISTPVLTLSTTTSNAEGRIAWDSTNDQLRIGDGASTRTISPDDKTATLTNKTINGSSNTITNVSLTTAVTGTLPVANGGTGITSFGTGIATFLGTPSSANLAAAVTDETGSGSLVFGTNPTITPAAGTTITATEGAGYMGMPQNSRSSNYTLVASDAGKHVYVTTTGQTITIPANGTTAFPVGTSIVVVNADSVSTSIAITNDTLRLANSSSTGTRTLASNGMCTLLKVASTTWIASGNGLT